MQALMHSREPVAAAALVAAGGAATILGAYFFQYVLKLPPCPLCLDQRVAYYVSIPLALCSRSRREHAPRQLRAAASPIIALAMLFNAGLALSPPASNGSGGRVRANVRGRSTTSAPAAIC